VCKCAIEKKGEMPNMKNKKQKKAVSYDANETKKLPRGRSPGRLPATYVTKNSITEAQYRDFQTAFDFLNRKLFADELPQLLVTLQRRGGTQGYFSPNRFTGRADGVPAHELALNPDCFTGQSDEEILGTLLHEMVHQWQQVQGHPPRRGYHDKAFAAKMKELGLDPSDTGKPGGRETGGHMSHYIVAGGPYARAYKELAATGFKLEWQSKPPDRKQRQSKTKFTCPSCGQNAWAKPDARLLCAACGGAVPMTAPAGMADAA
jgi:hypothetical protein